MEHLYSEEHNIKVQTHLVTSVVDIPMVAGYMSGYIQNNLEQIMGDKCAIIRIEHTENKESGLAALSIQVTPSYCTDEGGNE